MNNVTEQGRTRAGGGKEASDTGLTIDELARRAGMTVRNVRAHQSRGLLPPPEIRGRTGYYAEEHLLRLELIKDLQAEGLNLEAIKRIVENAPGSSTAEVLDFTRAVAAPFSEEVPEVVELSDLLEPWGMKEIDPALARRIVDIGFLRPLGGDRFEVRSPRLRKASRELAELGVSVETAIEVMALLHRHSRSIAKAYVKLFLDNVWRPFERSGEPSEGWPKVREALDRLRPQATQSLVSAFQMVLTDTVEEALERELSRMGDSRSRRGSNGTRRRRSTGGSRRGRKPRRSRRRS